ncbi:MAG: hypothetical protein U0835_00455 [Isosphaeraceae bacterium]
MTQIETAIDKRYFYTDPLAAAWMGKHFGMVFFTPEDDDYQEEVYGWESVAGAFDFDGAERVYVHPDSVLLLEPQDGDWLEIKDADYHLGSCLTSVWHGHSKALGLPQDHQYRGKEFRIIQRDGKAFMWPESDPS